MPTRSGSINGYFAQVTLDGSGNGTANLGPTRPREHWQPVSAAVKVATATKQASADLYIGSSINDNTFFSHTIKASSGDVAGMAGQDLQPGMQIWVKWQGGDAGSVATVTMLGSYTIGDPG